MVIAAIHAVAFLMVVGAGIFVFATDRFEKPSLRFAVLVVGMVSGFAMIWSGYYLVNYWAALMEQFDFTEITRPSVNPKRFPSKFYLWPAWTTMLGFVAGLVYARLLFQHLRDFKYFSRSR